MSNLLVGQNHLLISHRDHRLHQYHKGLAMGSACLWVLR